MYTFTINDENTIEVFVEGQQEPMLRQPHYPNGEAFDTKVEAEEWVELFIASMVDEDAPFAPTGKGLAGEPKPTSEQILEQLRSQAERFGEDVPEQLADRIAALEAELA
mgnify:CR=1 FL=1